MRKIASFVLPLVLLLSAIVVNTAPVQAEEMIWAVGANASSQYGNPQWSASQATGMPNTAVCGDQNSAWASATADGQQEWLELSYDKALLVRQINVHETFNPGALRRVEGFVNGAWITLWSGMDPNTACPGVANLPIATPLPVNKIKLYLDSPAVAGWNEIDAVALVGELGPGTVVWASGANASSQYSNPGWSAAQAVGAPNTNACGDQNSAWASATSDGAQEWLELSFPRVVTARAVKIVETFNPGAVRKVEAWLNGSWVVVWQGQDPNTACPGTATLQFSNALPVDKIRISLDSPAVAGWNEIDAVGLVE